MFENKSSGIVHTALLYLQGGARRADKLAPCSCYALICEAKRPVRLFRQVSLLKDTTDAYAHMIAGVLKELWSEMPDADGPPRCNFVATKVGWVEKLGEQIEHPMTANGVGKGGKRKKLFNSFEPWRDAKTLLVLSGSPPPRCPIGPECRDVLRLKPHAEDFLRAAPLALMAAEGALDLEELPVHL